MKTLCLTATIKSSWLKVYNFKKAYWLGTLYALIVYLIIGIISILLMFLANHHIAWVVLAGFIYLGGMFFVFLPLMVGIFRLSVLNMRGETCEAKSVYRYLNGSRLFKIGMIGIVSFFIMLLLSAIPSIIVQFILFFVFIWLSALALLAMLCVADKNISIDKIILFIAQAFKTNWWQLLVFSLLGYLMLFAGIITLGVAFIWLAPWYNNVWGEVYNQLMERPHADQPNSQRFVA